MLRNKFQLSSRILFVFDVLFIFSMFLLSNISAMLSTIWLIPQLVLGESIIWCAFAAISIFIIYKSHNIAKFLENLKRNWIILPFLIFSILSISWSVYWEISLYRWVTLFCTIITSGYIALRYSIKETIKLLSFFGIFILLISTIFILFIPHVGVMNYHSIQGAWSGVYWHKNHMGLIATFINILFLINIIDHFKSKGKQIMFWGPLYLYSLVFIYQTDSVAAYMTTISLHGVIFLSLMWMKLKNKLRKYHYYIFIAVLLFASLILWINLDHFLGIFNRNTTLTGRIPMWTYLFNKYVGERPFGGFGFNAFWYLDSHRVSMQIAAGYPDPIVIADNGFIDILVNTGYGGLILFLVSYLGMWWYSIKYTVKANNISRIFPVILMSYTLLANISWSLIFENESFFMLIMYTVLFCILIRTPRTSQSQNGI